jgi:hypothetical protein
MLALNFSGFDLPERTSAVFSKTCARPFQASSKFLLRADTMPCPWGRRSNETARFRHAARRRGGVAAWPFAALAQQPDRPVIGLLAIGTASSWNLAGFRQGLKDAGYVEGQNLAIEYRFANDDPARLPELASDLVRRKVRVIAAIASGLVVRAAKDATDTIPIVFGYGADPQIRTGHQSESRQGTRSELPEFNAIARR